MRKTPMVIATLLCMTGIAHAEPVSYALIKEKSHVKFVAIQNGAPVTGRFEAFDADILFDFKRPQDGKIAARIQTGSVTTEYEEVEKNLKRPEWLSVEAFPVAVFEATDIRQIPSTSDYFAEGTLTLKDVSAPVTLNFRIKDYGDTAIAEGQATLRRGVFGVGQGEWANEGVVKNEVRVEFRIAAKKI